MHPGRWWWEAAQDRGLGKSMAVSLHCGARGMGFAFPTPALAGVAHLVAHGP